MYYSNNYFVASVRFPDTYYMIQPIIKRICIEMDFSNFPTAEEIEVMNNRVFNEFVNVYPELVKEKEVTTASLRKIPRKRGRYYRNNQRRAVLKDLIAILLINELLYRRQSCD